MGAMLVLVLSFLLVIVFLHAARSHDQADSPFIQRPSHRRNGLCLAITMEAFDSYSSPRDLGMVLVC
jgi:hypothetical protein